MDKTDIGLKIKTAIESAGLSYIQLSEKINVSENTIGNWVRGKSSPDLIQLNMLASVCHKKMGWFFDENIAGTQITETITLPLNTYNELIEAKAQNQLLIKQLNEARDRIIELSLIVNQSHTSKHNEKEATNKIIGGTPGCGDNKKKAINPHSG